MLENIHSALLIYNLACGRRRHTRFAEIEEATRILKSEGIAAELAPTSCRGAATEIARQAAARNDELVIVCGGDGTINEAVNGLAGSRVPMAIFPAGTANILAKELGIPWDISAAARLIRGSTIRRIALGSVMSSTPQGEVDPSQGCRYFLSVAGAGPDGAIVHAVDLGLKDQTGILAYWAAGARQLVQYRFPEMAIASHAGNRNATLIVVGRTVNYGGPFKITTGANLFGDEFEIVAFDTRSRWRYLSALPAVWLGSLRSVPGIHVWKTRELTCSPANGSTIYAQVDGEPVGTLPLHFRIVSDALTLVVPAAANK
ncbi:MAG TPA: diacylglycerol kinase family protein [Candidatus Acidoferrales bacterium]